jgi:hypothetical protein
MEDTLLLRLEGNGNIYGCRRTERACSQTEEHKQKNEATIGIQEPELSLGLK